MRDIFRFARTPRFARHSPTMKSRRYRVHNLLSVCSRIYMFPLIREYSVLESPFKNQKTTNVAYSSIITDLMRIVILRLSVY
jgi:hypothetical protein